MHATKTQRINKGNYVDVVVDVVDIVDIVARNKYKTKRPKLHNSNLAKYMHILTMK